MSSGWKFAGDCVLGGEVYRAALNRQRDSQRPAKFEFKYVKKLRKSRPGGVPHRILGPKMEQISISDALVALELSWWRLGKFEKVLGGVLGPS